jgi:hypothetical protein
MMDGNWAILATGPSMSQSVADSLRGRNVIVVSDAFRLAPWAYALVSQDWAWWIENEDSFNFEGMQISSKKPVNSDDEYKLCRIHKVEGLSSAMNSGLLGCEVAKWFGAKRIELYGFDMQGTHFFGPHQSLKNTPPHRFEIFKTQFAQWDHAGIEVINMTPDSALTCFPRGV